MIRSMVRSMVQGFGSIPIVGEWILANGVWNDDGVWKDEATWNDGV